MRYLLLLVMLFISIGTMRFPMDQWTCKLDPIRCVDFGPNYPKIPWPTD